MLVNNVISLNFNIDNLSVVELRFGLYYYEMMY